MFKVGDKVAFKPGVFSANSDYRVGYFYIVTVIPIPRKDPMFYISRKKNGKVVSGRWYERRFVLWTKQDILKKRIVV